MMTRRSRHTLMELANAACWVLAFIAIGRWSGDVVGFYSGFLWGVIGAFLGTKFFDGFFPYKEAKPELTYFEEQMAKWEHNVRRHRRPPDIPFNIGPL